MPRSAMLDEVHSLMQQCRWREAIDLCTSSGMPDAEPDLLWSCAWAHFKLGDLATARTLFEASATLRPDHAATLWALGVVLHDLGLRGESKRRLVRALEIDDSTIARLQLVVVLMEEQDLAAAERVHLQGIRLQPSNADRYEAYADFLSDIGRAEEAAAQYARAESIRA